MVRKCSCIVCLICMTMMMSGKAQAAEKTGSIQVIPVWCGQPVVEGTVSISWVGMKEDDETVLTDGLANWYVDEVELQSQDWIRWLSQHTQERKQTIAVCTENGAAFGDLEEGIYLVEQLQSSENYTAFRPFLQTIPENGRWNLTISPNLIYTGEPPKTADYPAPIIGAMGIGLTAAILMVLADNRKK